MPENAVGTKQVIIIRRDLNMRRGKEIAQGAHASSAWLASWILNVNGRYLLLLPVILGYIGGIMSSWLLLLFPGLLFLVGAISLFLYLTNLTVEQLDWLKGRFTKITLQVPTEVELFEIYQKAKEAGLTVAMIHDSGATEFHGEETVTALAIGPHQAEKIDPITRHLKIY